MAKEIERRFLVKSLGANMPTPAHKIKIEQGYLELATVTKSLRIRICNNWHALLTSKTGKGISREEIELKIEDKDGNFDNVRSLYNGCDHKLEKERWIVGDWAVDIFKPPLQGIILAEKEMRSVDEPLTLPSWLQGAVEVTNLLTNHRLARLVSEIKSGREQSFHQIIITTLLKTKTST